MRYRIGLAALLATVTATSAQATACNGSFGYTGSIVSCTVSTTGRYAISLSGAQGGTDTNATKSPAAYGVGGKPVFLKLSAILTAGDSYDLLVGGRGGNGGERPGFSTGGGGGGGTFIVLGGTQSALAVAGGGGGGSLLAGIGASLGTAGVNGGPIADAGAGGQNGLGGQAGNQFGGGGGGGGLLGDGTPNGGAAYADGGAAFVNGGAGQVSSGYPGNGGFGGGGAGGWYGGGGGGGYSGGGGGANVRPGGGGGSYWDPTLTLIESQINYAGPNKDGTIYFELLEDLTPPAVPEPATWAMMIGGFALAGSSLRRRGARTAARTA